MPNRNAHTHDNGDRGTPPEPTPPSRRRLAWFLGALFALAMLMGPGPGILLVRPSPGDAQDAWILFGLPVIYAWGLLWFAVQGFVIVASYFLLWQKRGDHD